MAEQQVDNGTRGLKIQQIDRDHIVFMITDGHGKRLAECALDFKMSRHIAESVLRIAGSKLIITG